MPETQTASLPVTAAPPEVLDAGVAGPAWPGSVGLPPVWTPMPEPLRALLDAGGPVMLILAGLSVLALTIVLVKLWQFASLRGGGANRIEGALDAWRAGRGGEAVEGLAAATSPLAQIVHTAMAGRLHENDQAALREEIERRAGCLLAALRSHLRGLEVIASLSPLLGLLGTVIGMIEAFRALEAAGSRVDPAVLSGGIWVALLTTAAGLSVAIPTLVALTWLERLLEGVTRRLEDQVTRVFTAGLRLAGPAAPGAGAVAQSPAADAI